MMSHYVLASKSTQNSSPIETAAQHSETLTQVLLEEPDFTQKGLLVKGLQGFASGLA